MNCEKVREWFGEYWDLPEDDIRRHSLNEHIAECSHCAQEFKLWQESHELILKAQSSASSITMPPPPSVSIAERVMDRIYKDEAWRRPVADRIYSFSYKLRRNLTMILSFCMAMFTVSLVHSLFNRTKGDLPARTEEFTGLMPVANAVANSGSSSSVFESLEGVPVASISDPLILRIGHVPSSPDYFLVLSILGIIFTVLIMNWFARIKA